MLTNSFATSSTSSTSSADWKTGKCLVYFTAPGCGYCQLFAPEWAAAVNNLQHSGSHIRSVRLSTENTDMSAVEPEVFGFPTVRAYHNGKMVAEYDGDRTASSLLSFANRHLTSGSSGSNCNNNGPAGLSQNHTKSASRTAFALSRNQKRGGARHRFRRSSQARSRKRIVVQQHGGMAPISFIGKPVDTPSRIPPELQSTNASTSLKPSPPHGGLYHPDSPPAAGGWGSIRVPATSTSYIHSNLRSANPPPGAISQYPTAANNRPGNNHSAKPGVHGYLDGTTHTLHCTKNSSRLGQQRAGKGSRRRHRRRRSRRHNFQHRRSRRNMACSRR